MKWRPQRVLMLRSCGLGARQTTPSVPDRTWPIRYRYIAVNKRYNITYRHTPRASHYRYSVRVHGTCKYSPSIRRGGGRGGFRRVHPVSTAAGVRYTEGMSARDDSWDATRPRDHFASLEAWRAGEPLPGSPLEVRYACMFAARLREELDLARAASTTSTSAAGLADLAERTGISGGLLRQYLDGNRWPSLSTVAQVECTFKRAMTGWVEVTATLIREGRPEELDLGRKRPLRRMVRRHASTSNSESVPPAKSERDGYAEGL